MAVGRLMAVGRKELDCYVDCAIRYLCLRALRLNLHGTAVELAKTHSKVGTREGKGGGDLDQLLTNEGTVTEKSSSASEPDI